MKDFIRIRLNKDNFWNLMFFFGMLLGFGIAGLIVVLSDNTFPTFAGIICWITIIAVPWIVKRNSFITFDKKTKQLLNRNNEPLNNRILNIIALIFSTMGVTTLIGLIFDSIQNIINDSIASTIMLMLPLLIPTIYCILKNLPIAVYFKKETWIGDGTNNEFDDDWKSRKNNTYVPSTTENFMHPNNIYRDSRNSSLPGNIFYRK